MYQLAAIFAILVGRAVFASDVQPNDFVFAMEDGVACSDWTSFQAFRETNPRALKVKLPADCLIIYGDPVRLFVDSVENNAAAVCVRPYAYSGPCLWFSLGKVKAQLSPGQRRV